MESTEPKAVDPPIEKQEISKEPQEQQKEDQQKPQEISADPQDTTDSKKDKNKKEMYERFEKTKYIPPDPEREEERKHQKKNPKRKTVMIVGYNGADFCGSQKQSEDGIRTVESDLEKALFEAGMIDYRNYGDLKKIRWTRATRTDKRVHALQNCFSGKLLIDQDKELKDLAEEVNAKLCPEIRIFGFLPGLGGFDAKHAASFREYEYYMPTFMLSSDINIKYTVPEDQPIQDIDPDNPRCIKRVKVNVDSSCLEEMYEYRLPDAKKKILEGLLSKFEGTHKYHNYTKQMKSKDKNSQRYIMQVKVLDYRVYDGIEFARVFLQGQSFLYNQIRKMMGAVFMVMHYGISEKFIENSLKDNQINVPTAPGEGLMLNRVAFDRYNKYQRELKAPILPFEHKKEEMEEFRVGLVKFICSTEKNTNCFTKWLGWMHEARSNFISI
ncbi:unnamed protein product [Moneuplotes crassus]|uniref:Pseudouridine synthase I TruA alpha/beta domain-containing protein n=1 Tax=Euplotes crassus TaxID=5936 RepID=A0AAD1XFI3_EUPCR|nr:unnamed protein product [Moneuplotes crassus]